MRCGDHCSLQPSTFSDVPESESRDSRASWRTVLPASSIVILAIVAALVGHTLVQQGSFIECHHRLDNWFRIACLQGVVFWGAFATGRSAENGANWWFVDPHSWTGKASFTCTWAVLLPLFAGWTVLGMTWLIDTMHNTPDCFPPGGFLTPTIYALFLVICGAGAAAYAVFVANVWDAARCRRANAAAIQCVEDCDLLKRWGPLKPAATMELCGGLLPGEFADLPRHAVDGEGGKCVICLNAFMEGDHARALPGCGHMFHRACIDLWFLRSARCPLCNTGVRSDKTP